MSKDAPTPVSRRNLVQLGGAGLLWLHTLKTASAQGPSPSSPGKRYSRLPNSEIAKHIDRAWVRKSLINDLLDYWVKASVMPSGFIQENLDRKWQGWGEQRDATINGQGRVLYTLAIGYDVTRERRYLDAINRAAGFLLKMHDDQYGGYFNRTTPDLKVLEDTKSGYQSFVIFSLAHAGRVTRNQRYTEAAMAAYHELKAKMADGPFIGGGPALHSGLTGRFPWGGSGPPVGARARMPMRAAASSTRREAIASTFTCSKPCSDCTRPPSPKKCGTRSASRWT